MDATLADLLHVVRCAKQPEDVFGALSTDGHAALKRRYRELAVIAHPDRNPGFVTEANEAFQALQAWYALAHQRVTQGLYGVTPRIRAATKLHHYIGYEPPLHGDLCDLFPVDLKGSRVLLKVARKARNNDLLQAEAQTLKRIQRELEGQPVRAHFPTLLEHFLLRDEIGVNRHTNVLRAESGCVSLADVLEAYPRGIEAADAAWMFNRILAALGCIHSLGIVHGALVPTHVLIRPSDHNGMLIDWCYSVASGEAAKAVSPRYATFYPPEVHAKQPATPATDLYMAARCMAWLLGSDSTTGELPPTVPKPIRRLLRACLIASSQRRVNDAWKLFDDFQEILYQLYGPPTFRPFRMPAMA